MEENKEIKKEIKKETKHKEDKKCKEKDELIKTLQDKVNELEDKNMRISAEMINSLRRKDEELNRLLKFKDEDLILEILPIIDNFERALSQKDSQIENYQKGIEMIYNNLVNVLNKFEVKEIEALGCEFDPGLHQAVMTEHHDDKKENEVIEILQKGYIYKDKVIRPAMVKVNM